MIYSLEIDNIINFNIIKITKHILDYFKNLLGTTDTRLVSLDPQLWGDLKKIDSIQITRARETNYIREN
jgi:hypothetical protein